LAALESARSAVDVRGDTPRRSIFYQLLAWQRAQRARYRVDEEVIANMRKGVAAAAGSGDEACVAYAHQRLGLFLLLRGDLVEAQEYLDRALAVTERIGDIGLGARTLLALTVTALRRQDVDAVRTLAPRAMAACEAAGNPDFMGVAGAKASLAWLAWQDNRPLEVVTLAREAMELSGAMIGENVRSDWVFLWPLVALHLSAGRTGEAVPAGLRMLEPVQQQMPDELESLLRSAGAAWTSAQDEAAATILAQALGLARELHFF
jgi:hypothetical protein